jgi:4-hydroxybenzoate polyprenyltransferase
MIIVAVLTIKRALAVEYKLGRTAWIGAGIVVTTVAFGVLTMMFKSNWWSYLMAIGFIASFVVYGILLVRVKTVQY